MTVVNPATNHPLEEIESATISEVSTAISRANAAFPQWSRQTDRAVLLQECAKILRANAVKLAPGLTQEQGKPLKESIEELMGASHWLRATSEFELPQSSTQSSGSAKATITRQAIGTVGAITPWNYPVLLPIWKIAPALLTGNCVILKPSPYTPLSILTIAKLFEDILPKSVLQIINGGDEIGRALVEHTEVKHISLTGSIEAGRSVGAQAGRDLKTTTLELGGNDPALVLEEADPEKAASAIFANAFKNCGQTCMAIKRVYVHRSKFEAFTETLSSLARAHVVGNGLEKGTQMGPINNLAQLSHVENLVATATAQGGTLLAGGQALESEGYFFEPTIITDLPNDQALVTEEQFGPALPVLAYDDLDEAIKQANGTRYGLGASVWTPDLQQASEVASQLECGTTWINQHSTTDPTVPFGGIKDSGLGLANGQMGLEEYTRVKISYSS